MRNIEEHISPLIQTQFPEFYRSDGELFVAFAKKYFEFLETEGSETRKILSYRDIDYTVDDFQQKFHNEFLNGMPSTVSVNKALLIKNVQDLYKSKGSAQSFKLLFKLLYNDDIQVYDPSVDLLRVSDGQWIIPVYLECARSDRAVTFIGQQITGARTGATAFVENVVRKNIQGKFVDVIYISKISGSFETGEYITNNNSLEGAPYITGSLNIIEITEGGSNNSIGDVFNVTGDGGILGTAVVRGTAAGTGKVEFELEDGGWGYTNTSTIMVSNSVIAISNVSGSISFSMTVYQPLIRVDYTTLTGANSFSVFDEITAFNGANASIGTGYVISSNTSSNTVGNVVISMLSGNWSTANTIRLTSNSNVNAVPSNTANVTSYGLVLNSNNTHLGLRQVTGEFYDFGYVYGYLEVPLGLSTSNTATPNITSGVATTVYSQAEVGDRVYFRANNATIGYISAVNSNTSITLLNNSSFTFSNTTIYRTDVSFTANTGRVYDTGNGASFAIASVSNTESVNVFNVPINDVNSGGIPYLDMLISGENSNVSSNGYGFPGNTAITYSNGMIGNSWIQTTVSLGTIVALTSINPGTDYNVNPMIRVRESSVAGLNYVDQLITLANTNSLFSPGQKIYQGFAVGKILGVSGNNLTIRRMSVYYPFTGSGNTYSVDENGTTIGIGSTGGMTPIANTEDYMGFNAVINTTLKTASGITTTLEVLSSGFGYVNGQDLVLEGVTQPNTLIFGTANVYTQGQAAGYWKNDNGKLNSNKYLHDNKYYQEYSYEIQSSKSLDVYSDILKKVLHLAGTRLFGKTIIKSQENVNLTTPGVRIEIT